MSQTGFVNKLSVPMRKEDNEALSEVRAALEKKLGKRLSNAQAIRELLKNSHCLVEHKSDVKIEIGAFHFVDDFGN